MQIDTHRERRSRCGIPIAASGEQGRSHNHPGVPVGAGIHRCPGMEVYSGEAVAGELAEIVPALELRVPRVPLEEGVVPGRERQPAQPLLFLRAVVRVPGRQGGLFLRWGQQ